MSISKHPSKHIEQVDQSLRNYLSQVKFAIEEDISEVLVAAQLLLSLLHHQFPQIAIAAKGHLDHSDGQGQLLNFKGHFAELAHLPLHLVVGADHLVVVLGQPLDGGLEVGPLGELLDLLLHLLVAGGQSRVELLHSRYYLFQLFVLIQQLQGLVSGFLELLDQPQPVLADAEELLLSLLVALGDGGALNQHAIGPIFGLFLLLLQFRNLVVQFVKDIVHLLAVNSFLVLLQMSLQEQK